MRIHHVGIAVESLESAVPVFEVLLGASPSAQENVEDQKVRVAIFQVGESRIELLESTVPDSPVGRFIGKRGPGIHHLTLAVENLRSTLEHLEGRGVRLVDRQPRPGAGQESVAFLHPSSTAGILIELLEAGGAGQPHQDQETGKE